MIVPMSGEIGEEITLEAFTEVFEDAIKAGVEAVIVDLTSPGGFVTTLDGIHEYLYGSSIAPASKTRVVFYVDGDCFSAAALLALCAEELWVANGATIGAAVPLSFNANGVVEVEAKFASAFASSWRANVDRAGRDGLLADAMIRTETEVWADTSVTPWALHPNDNGQMESPRLLDGKATILTLTGADAVAMGIASHAESIRDVIRGLKLENPEREAFRGLEVVKRVRRQQSRAMVDFERRVKAIDETFDELVRELPDPEQGGGQGGPGGPGGGDEPRLDPKKVIAACTRAIAVAERCKRMLEVSDYLQIAALRRDITIGSIEAAIVQFKDLLELARNAD